MSNIFIGLKMTCLGVLDREKRDNDNETGLKEGGGIGTVTAVLHSRCSLFRFSYFVFYLPFDSNLFFPFPS